MAEPAGLPGLAELPEPSGMPEMAGMPGLPEMAGMPGLPEPSGMAVLAGLPEPAGIPGLPEAADWKTGGPLSGRCKTWEHATSLLQAGFLRRGTYGAVCPLNSQGKAGNQTG